MINEKRNATNKSLTCSAFHKLKKRNLMYLQWKILTIENVTSKVTKVAFWGKTLQVYAAHRTTAGIEKMKLYVEKQNL